MRAARGADARPFPWGTAFDWGFAVSGAGSWHAGGVPRPLPIGAATSDVSPFGVLDLAGSVSEFCTGTAKPFSGSPGVVRGGAWNSEKEWRMRAATRLGAPSGGGKGWPFLGFRVRADPYPR